MADYRAIFERMPDGVTLHDPADGSILDTNQRFCDMLGYRRDELLELDFQAIHVDEPPYTTEQAQAYIRKAATEGPQTFEWRDATKDGRPLPVEVNLRLTTIDGQERILAVVRDITERKERERQLYRETERFRTLFENTNDAVAWVEYEDKTPYIRQANPRFRELFEEPVEDVVDRPLDDVVASGDRRQEAEEVSERVRTGTETSAELIRDTVHGPRTFLWEAIPLEEPTTDDVRHAFAVYTDVTELRERERELERKNDRLNEFARVISHDLRNPLSVAEGRVGLAAEACESDHLDAAQQALARMKELIGDVLALAQAGEALGDVEEVALADLTEACWQHVETGNATLEIETDLRLHADKTQLRHLLENLIRNAVEHGGDDVLVSIGATEEGFYVEDDGPGIPEPARERVFDPGYSSTDEGTGFGLNIVADIVDAHGWDVSVIEGADGGARFEISTIETP